jgi:hypothetical protein
VHSVDAIEERYGDGVLPWIASRIGDDGVVDDPTLGMTSLLWRSRSPEAFDVAARIRGVDSVLPWFPGPDEPGPLATWILEQPELGSALLAGRLLRAGGATLLEENAARTLHRADPRGTRQRMRAGLDPADAARLDRLLDGLDLPVPPVPEEVRAALDAVPVVDLPPSLPVAIAQFDWYAEEERHSLSWIDSEVFDAAMRLTAYVTPGGTDGLVFECLVVYRPCEPDTPQRVTVDLHRFGFGLPPGPHPHISRIVLDREAAAERAADLEPMVYPFGDLTPVEQLAYRMSETRADRDRIFLAGADLAAFAQLPPGAVPLFTLDSWAHPDGVDDKRSHSAEWVYILEALRERRAITESLTGRTRNDHIRFWISRYRRTVRDYERLPQHHATIVQWSMIIIMTRRLAHHHQT